MTIQQGQQLAAIWVRISDPHHGTTENQLPVLQQWAEQRGLKVVRTFQVEESASRSQTSLVPLLDAARMGEFQILLIWALDRLSRRGAAAILNIVAQLEQYGVQVWSHQEAWLGPGSSATQELMLSITGWIARAESERMGERIRAGVNRARPAGKVIGRPKGAKDKKKRRRAGYFERYAR